MAVELGEVVCHQDQSPLGPHSGSASAVMTWVPEIGPVRVRASSTLLNGSEELGHEEPTGIRRSRSSASCREADRLLGEGIELPEVVKELEVSEATYHRWRAQYGGMKADDVKRLKELEVENARLKRIVADQTLEIAALKEIAKGNW